MKTCSHKLANVVIHWATTPAIAALSESHACDLCTQTFRTKQSLALHKFKTHGVKSIERQYVHGTQCPICLAIALIAPMHVSAIKKKSTIDPRRRVHPRMHVPHPHPPAVCMFPRMNGRLDGW